MTKERLPHIHILAMGGTIAGRAANAAETVGYRAGAIGINELLEAVPQLTDIAEVTGETVASIDSKDMTEALMIKLARRTEECLLDDSIDGIVITHGTDTLEESAFFLSLTLSSAKPVIFTGAMRPATALSADGPLNLLDAVHTASSPDAKNRGILVVMNGTIHDASDVTKRHTSRVDTFQSPNRGAIGAVTGGHVHFFYTAAPVHNLFPIPSGPLPEVEILYGHENESRILVDALINSKVSGIIYAGTGMGSISETVLPALREAQEQGIAVVRASRTGSGAVIPTSDYPLPFISAGTLVPQKSRILLQLLLVKKMNPSEIQHVFNLY
ncbi:L-asparaginase [Schwartzia succinivorans DSM 10502]|jgi:L-asparaginase|uniref:L-asparaginase n=1 Tax=Schwartzia succinivorans DSM 10502 TaxID=1123243 RepID=A0A1M5B0R6_9FIRM|nr:L-asparaginase [Schwartzia succinivorans DSM 10502]